MKTITLFLLCLVLLSSCSKDEEVYPEPTLTIMNAIQQNDSVIITWKTEGERGIAKYDIEHSTDSITFSTVNTSTLTSNNGGTFTYMASHSNPVSGNNYYRVKATKTVGGELYSNIVKLIVTACSLTPAEFPGTYKLTALTYQPDAASPVEDIYATMDPCERDDNFVFHSNSTYDYVDAGTICTPPGHSAGSYSLSGNSLNIDGDIATVSNFSCSGFTLTFTGPSGDVTIATLIRL